MSLAQKKLLARRRAQFEPDTCSCGGTVIERDHGTWIGWFCPKCKAGGSKQKQHTSIYNRRKW